MQDNKAIAASAILLSLVLYAVGVFLTLPPEAKPATAPAAEFSAERAHNVLAELLRENKPHPVGSPLNKIVKERIMARMRELGIEVSEQRTWACAAKFTGCAFVENIIGIIPGKEPGPYVTLMAHYDSVPMAPGAGDDMAAVVAILETARILKSETPLRNPVMLLITDAEEMGLIGAEGFYLQHELADEIGVVLDFEGSGTSGPSMALRTSVANELLINTFWKETANPFGTSLTGEIFRRMPNDTDFSTVLRAEIPGIDFAFAGERNHYHTPNDNVANIDLHTIQHHGENMLPLTRALAEANLSTDQQANLEAIGGTLVYSPLYGYLLRWSTELGPWLLLLTLVLLGVGARQLGATLKGSFRGLGVAFCIVFSTSFVAFVAFKIAGLVVGTIVSWPATYLPWRTVLLFSALTGALLATTLANRGISRVDMYTGVWGLWFLLAALLTAFMPDTAISLTASTLAAATVFATASLLPEKTRAVWLTLSLVVAVPATLGPVLLMEQSQGYRLIAATFPLFGLFFAALSPFLIGNKLKLPLTATGALTVAAIVWVSFSPLYSAWRPQHLNINFVEDTDAGTAFIDLQSQNPVRKNLAAVMDFESDPKALIPFSTQETTNWVETEVSGLPGPTATITNTIVTETGKVVDITLGSPRGAGSIAMVLPESANLTEFRLDGRAFVPELLTKGLLQGQYFVMLRGTYDRAVELQLTLETTELVEANLYDASTELPGADAAALVKARPPLASPVHRGDQAILMRKISF